MKHHAFPAAMGLLIAAALVPTSVAHAASADPTGIWRKADQGERPGKIEVFRCGAGQRLLCAKIVWLQNPLDSKGRPLHDVRNENASMRDRPILGLPIINGMQPVGPNVWKGSIYNPEDGGTYSATLTLVSRNQITLKGCKAWLLCGERTWLRTTPPPKAVPEPEEQIEASAEPQTPAKPAANATAAAEPEAAAPEEEDAFAAAEVLTPATEHDPRPGYRFLNGATTAESPHGYSGENVPSMFAMTKPIEDEEAGTEGSPAGSATKATPPPPEPAPAAAPAPRPQPQTMQANATAAPRPSTQTPPATQAPSVPPETQAEVTEQPAPQTAATAVTEQPPLTRRERRLLRRQQQQGQGQGQGLLPWLR
jgi:uncharacterized protein (DUF2147 family)